MVPVGNLAGCVEGSTPGARDPTKTRSGWWLILERALWRAFSRFWWQTSGYRGSDASVLALLVGNVRLESRANQLALQQPPMRTPDVL